MSNDDVLDLKPTVSAWAEIVIKEWLQKISAFNIGDTGALAQSFMHHVYWHAGGDLQKIEFAFKFYGRFVDWGVGKGVSLSGWKALTNFDMTARRPKPWFSDVFYKQKERLLHLLSERMGEKLQVMVVRSISDDGDASQNLLDKNQ